MHKNIKNIFESKITILLFILFILIRLLYLQYPFWGLEYEDSFIYSDTGRYLHYSYDFTTMPFKCQSCLDGSYNQCYQYGSFGGHLLTLPILLHIYNTIFGYNASNIFELNLIFSVLLSGLVYYCWSKFHNKHRFSINVFLLIMSITPFVTIFNTSGLAETISSVFVIGFLLNIYRANESNFDTSTTSFWLTIIFLILAVITKRENFILLIFMYLMPLIRYLYGQSIVFKTFILMLLISTVTLLLFSYFIDLFGIENNESIDISENTFSFRLLKLNLKQLILAITDLKFWGLTGYIFLGSILITGLSKKITKLGLMSLILAVFYIILYSSHYRSYYQVVHNLSYPFETLRYSTNYLPLIALFTSTIKFDNKYWSKLTFNKTFFNLSNFSCIALTFGLVANVALTRSEFSQDENGSRIQPVIETLSVIDIDDVIITSIPIVFRCYADENQKIIDLFKINNNRLRELKNENPHSSIFILKPTDMEIESNRYGLMLDYSDFEQISFDSKNFILLKQE